MEGDLVCCRRCRLVTTRDPRVERCELCGDDHLVRLAHHWEQLLGNEVVGLELQRRDPPTGWTDHLWALTTAIAFIVTWGVAGVLVGPLVGFVGAVVVGAAAYNAQFRRGAWKRRPVLKTVPSPVPPAGGVVGVVAVWERRLTPEGGVASQLVLEHKGQILFRSMTSVPFLVMTDDGPIVVEKTSAVSGASDTLAPGHVVVDLGLPADVPMPKGTRLSFQRITEGQRVRVCGGLEHKVVPGLGYRGGEARVGSDGIWICEEP